MKGEGVIKRRWIEPGRFEAGDRYRNRLKTLLENGSFSKEPGREKLMRAYLDAWDDWAREGNKQSAVMKWAIDWMWCGFFPQIIAFFYAALWMERDTRAAHERLNAAQIKMHEYNHKHGSSAAEDEAILYLLNEWKKDGFR